MISKLVGFFIGCVAFPVLHTPVFAQTAKHTPTNIDYEMVTEYEKIGATYVGWNKRALFPFVIGNDEERGFPGFLFQSAKSSYAFPKLPQVPIPFVICLNVSADTLKHGVKQFSELENLAGLALEGAGVTDAGLNEVLSALPRLAYLGLYRTRVTEAGIRDVSARKNIVSISFHPSEITDDSIRVLASHDLIHRLSRAEGKSGKRPASLD